MSAPGARGPSGRGAPSPKEQPPPPRPPMDRTASLPNLGPALVSAPQRDAQRRHQQHDEARDLGRHSGNASPTSERSTNIASAAAPTPARPQKCRPIPAKSPIQTDRATTTRDSEKKSEKKNPPTRTNEGATVRTAVPPTRQTTTQPRPTATGNAKSDRKYPELPRLSPRNIPGTSMPPPTAAARGPARQIATPPNLISPPPVPCLSMASTAAADIRTASRDPRLQRAPLSAALIAPPSPAPPRTSAYDSPAMRGSAYSSRSGSSLSLTSAEHGIECEMPTSPTPSMEMELDYQTDVRAQRRRRSSGETAEEEAKRYCDAARLGANPPTFAETVRYSRTPESPSAKTRMTIPTAAPELPSAENSSATVIIKKNKRPRYPPLVVEKLPNWASHFRALAKLLGHPPNARPYGQGVRFSPESEHEYRVVQRYLTTLEKEINISWFAYSLPAEKKLKIAIRGLPPDTDPQEIEEELRDMGYEPEYVRHINARQGRPGCVFHAVLNKTENVRAIYDTSVFMMMRGVKIEAWRGKRGPAQCHRCQKFRHSSHQCHRPLACVRCGEGHVAKDCQRPREEPATCANCGGPHPANNIKCPVFQREIKFRRVGTAATTTTTHRPQKVTNTVTETTEEAQGASLMAAANGPTQRGEAASSSGRRKKNKKGGKSKKLTPSTPLEETQRAAPDAAPDTTKVAQAVKNVNKEIATDNLPLTKRHLASKVGTESTAGQPTGQTKKNKQAPPRVISATLTAKTNKDFTACAIQLLMDLIKAIRQGQDIEQVILDGLAALLKLYHHV